MIMYQPLIVSVDYTGAWFPIAIAAGVFSISYLWKWGTSRRVAHSAAHGVQLDDVIQEHDTPDGPVSTVYLCHLLSYTWCVPRGVAERIASPSSACVLGCSHWCEFNLVQSHDKCFQPHGCFLCGRRPSCKEAKDALMLLRTSGCDEQHSVWSAKR